ncbi:MAG: hypothetical protein ACFB11_11945 [Paracoccaceae bacterium]
MNRVEVLAQVNDEGQSKLGGAVFYPTVSYHPCGKLEELGSPRRKTDRFTFIVPFITDLAILAQHM